MNEELIVDEAVEVADVVVTDEGAKKGLTLGQGILIATGVYFGYKLGKKVYHAIRDKIKAHKEAKKANTFADVKGTSETTE